MQEDWHQYLPNGARYSEAGFFGPTPTRVGAPPSVGGQIAAVAMIQTETSTRWEFGKRVSGKE
jgi:hypothetical protein